MRLYAITMFVHILGVIAMFGGFAMQQRSGARLRHAATADEARHWAEVLHMTRPMVPSGVAFLLVTGSYLAFRLGGARPPTWVVVAAVTVLSIGVIALALVNPGFAAISRALASGSASAADATVAIARPTTWSALAAINGAALGTLWLMTARPALVEAVVAVTLPAVIGGVIGARLATKARERLANAPLSLSRPVGM